MHKTFVFFTSNFETSSFNVSKGFPLLNFPTYPMKIAFFPGLGPKDNPFYVAIQNNVEGFDSTKLAKKIKDDKICDHEKVVFAATPAEMLENLVKVL